MSDPTSIRARPTTYEGSQMRSRLEADYAASLDRMGRRWAYEPQCFASAAGQWLPDFGSDWGSDDGQPYAYLTEIKPAGMLEQMIAQRSSGDDLTKVTDYIDEILKRMEIALASQPCAILELVFWRYGGPAYMTFLNVRGLAWTVSTPDWPLGLPGPIWPGMGQWERVRKSLDGR
jgi:hypothetical protein